MASILAPGGLAPAATGERAAQGLQSSSAAAAPPLSNNRTRLARRASTSQAAASSSARVTGRVSTQRRYVIFGENAERQGKGNGKPKQGREHKWRRFFKWLLAESERGIPFVCTAHTLLRCDCLVLSANLEEKRVRMDKLAEVEEKKSERSIRSKRKQTACSA